MDGSQQLTFVLPPLRLERRFRGTLAFLTDETLFDACGTMIAFSERTGGVSTAPYDSLNLAAHVGDALVDVTENRSLLLQALSIETPVCELVVPRQVHGDEVAVIRCVQDVACVQDACVDAIVCTACKIPVMLCFADCVPIIAVAPKGEFSIIHAGWRGVIAHIASKALRILAEESDTDICDINVYIGPHIGADDYEVDKSLLERFAAEFGPSCDCGAEHLSLTAALQQDLFACGVAAERLAICEDSTASCKDRFFSYRVSGGVCGRQAACAYRLEEE